jgi:signal transduction histidine kinase
LAFASRQRDDYDRMDREFFLAIAGALTEALERQRLESELQRHASDLEQMVNDRTAKLRETIADLEGFSYSLVHDMRAPLRAMQTFAAVLEEDCGRHLDPQGLDYLGNAVEFVAPGVTPRVRVWAETRTPGRALIWVEDNGIGIPRDAQEKVFGLFQRMHRIEEYPGTGIGLAIVKKSLERIGGQVCLDSEPGKGSRFCVELPLARSEPGPPEPTQTA